VTLTLGIREKLQLANSSEKLPVGVFKVGVGMEGVVDDYLKGLEMERKGEETSDLDIIGSAKYLSNLVLQQVINDYPSSLVGITILNGGSVVGDTMTELKTIPRGYLEIEISKITFEPGLGNFDLPLLLDGDVLLMDYGIETGSTAIMAIRYHTANMIGLFWITV
jgi:uracil phosphoribosyltransferase